MIGNIVRNKELDDRIRTKRVKIMLNIMNSMLIIMKSLEVGGIVQLIRE